MKILLRSDYKWHDATFDNQDKLFNIDQNVCYHGIDETSIVSVKDDNRSDFVICSGCGEVVKNTKAAIKKHLELGKSSQTCFNCKKMRETSTTLIGDRKYVLNEDGTYTVHEKRNSTLCCTNNSYYSGPSIDSEQARQRCKYSHCSADSMKSYEDTFTKYPGLFDEVITIDALNKKKWKFEAKYHDSILFKATGSLRLYACINNYGIVDKFTYSYRNNDYDCVYSKKYNKLFWFSYGKYVSKIPSSNITSANLAKITEKIQEVYEG